jgi:aerobic-type carbon monoxide dehydrogenase small subunit (CoxS/CutS family)
MTITVTVNGVSQTRDVEPRLLLSDFLRQDLGLTGTHVGCEHGVCGACTVLLDGEPARSCLMFAVQADDHAVQTVEGLAPPGELGPLQDCGRGHDRRDRRRRPCGRHPRHI